MNEVETVKVRGRGGMEERNIYHDIAKRTDGDIYIGEEVIIGLTPKSSGNPNKPNARDQLVTGVWFV